MRLLLVLALAAVSTAAEPLITLDNCRYIQTEWGDGDSFRVRTADGSEHTIRLYGVDCIEWHVSDDSDARRLRAQRRYFGIAEFGGSPQSSIETAKKHGAIAGRRTAELLAKPFSVHTAHADARGDGKYKRIYAFVTTSRGTDLAAELVREGLARAHGVYRETPEGKSANDYREELADLELHAAKKEAGVWRLTDWDKLTGERQLERKEAAELSIAIVGAATLEPNSINPNTAARDELMKLPGIGEVTANRIIEGRPYTTVDDLESVSGIGEKTLERIRPFIRLPESNTPRTR